MLKLILDDFLKLNKKEIDENFILCEKCSKEIPNHVALCWNCGNVLDKSLRKLMQSIKK